MPDTVRSEAEILTIFADNNIGAISPQDLRDFVVSVYDEPAAKTLDGVSNPGGNIDLIAGTGIAITPNNISKTITVALSGSTPSGIESVDGVDNDGGNVDFIAGSGITITPNNTLKTITFDVTATQVGAIVSVDGVDNDGGNVDFIAGSGITITPNNTLKTITFDVPATTPGGSTTQIQYNNAGAFGGDSGFTTNGAGSVNITGDLDVDNININGNSITSTNTNGAIIITPNGTGSFQLDTSGNTRGSNAVDFQSSRVSTTQVASGSRSFIAGGKENTAVGFASFANGNGSIAAGGYSCAMGNYARALGVISQAFNDSTVASGESSHAEGVGCVTGYEPRSFTVSGTTVTIAGVDVTTEFIDSDTVVFFNLTGGTNNTLFVATRSISSVVFVTDTTFTISSVLDDRTTGECASHNRGAFAHAEGNATVARGIGAHSEGTTTVASGDYAHAEGQGSVASSTHAHAEGYNTTASADAAHAEGYNTTASGSNSHAEGSGTVAGGANAHAEGFITTASGPYAHAEGYNTTASGIGSHAEGFTTTAYGLYSHAEGNTTTATGNHSHAMGENSTAWLNNQFVHASGQFEQSGDSQFSRVIVRRETTNATPAELTLDGSAPASLTRITVQNDTLNSAWIRVAAISDEATQAEFIRRCLIYNNAGTTALVGSVQTVGTDIGSNAGVPPAGWTVAVTANDTNDYIAITVTGEAGMDIRWVAVVELVEVYQPNDGGE